MNIKATFYSAFTRLLYFLVYPFVRVLDRSVSYPALLIYNIARCEGYSKQAAIILVQQSQLESGNFTSNLYKNGRNMFGMKKPFKRPTLSKEYEYQLPEGAFATFNTLAESVLDRIMWDEYFKIDSSLNGIEYLTSVQEKGYAQDGKYMSKVLSIEPQLDFSLPTLVTAFYSGLALTCVLIVRYRTK